MSSNTTRIAKNTLMLYFRQILIMLVSLYTVRVVLETLGAEDYGIYNVVAGIVTMFGFLSGSMATASQRYFSFELGRGDFDQLQKVFSISLLIYFFIIVIVLLLAETIGLWFVANKLAIPPERKGSAQWVYQFAIISFIFTILTSPYMAMIIAHEDMNIYAYVSIADALLRLGAVFILRFITWDKLTLYSLLVLSTTVIITAIYRIICLKKYKQCKFSFYWNKDLIKEIASYSGWNMFGSVAWIGKAQLINILLNQIFSPVIVAARSIAVTVNNAVMSFSQNFSTAMRPPIIKSYAAGQNEMMFSLMFRGSKGTFLLMYLFVLPLALEMPIVLELWLKIPPEYSVLFTRLMLFEALIDSMCSPIVIVVQATGKVRMYQSVFGGIQLLNLPIVWIVLMMGYPPYSVMIVAIILTFIACIFKLLMSKRLVDYSIRKFVKTVFVPVCVISITSAILPVIICYTLAQGILRLCLVIVLSIVSVSFCSYFIALNNGERENLKSLIVKYLFKQKNKE